VYTYVYSCTRTEVRKYEGTRALQGLHKRVHVQYNVVRIAEVRKYGSTFEGTFVLFSKVLSYESILSSYEGTKVVVLPYFRTCTSGSTSVHTSGSMHDSPMILPSFVLYLRTKVPSYLQYLFSKVFYSIYSMLLPYESTKVRKYHVHVGQSGMCF
jgi:hypothetical protein